MKRQPALHLVAVLVVMAWLGPGVHSAQCELDVLSAPDLASNSVYSFCVALDGEVALVGVPDDDTFGDKAGSAKVFRRVDDTWELAQTLVSPDIADGDSFGFAVEVSGDTAFCTSRHADASVPNQGAVYVFHDGPQGFEFSQKLLSSQPESGAGFGYSIGVDGALAAFGSPNAGRAQFFKELDGTWVHEQTIQGSGWDLYGYSMSLHGDLCVVGAPERDDGASNAGAAFVYLRQAGVWTLETLLVSSTPYSNGFFGWAVSTDGSTIVVGAPGEGSLREGAAHVFELSESWSQTARMTMESAITNCNFGSPIAVAGDTVVVGGREGVFLFRRQGVEWPTAPTSQLVGSSNPADLGGSLAAGESLGIAADRVLVGDLANSLAYEFLFDSPALCAFPRRLSVTSGATQTLVLKQEAGNYLDIYFLLGSASGTAGGLVFGAHTLPLTPDPYLILTATHPNSGPLVSSIGLLDDEGGGKSWIEVPPLGPGLVGAELHHAYLVLESSGQRVVAVSNATDMLLID